MFITTPEQVAYILKQRTDSKTALDYYNECRAEAKFLAPYLANAKTILDIGCGMAGIDVELHSLLGDRKFFLIDKEDNASLEPYGFLSTDRFYNKLSLTRQFVSTNAPEMRFTALSSVVHQSIKNLDAIISIYSCAWHYPIDEYIDLMNDNLNFGGILILDVRGTYTNECIQTLSNFDMQEMHFPQPQRGTRYIFKKK